jgi:plastocyanin
MKATTSTGFTLIVVMLLLAGCGGLKDATDPSPTSPTSPASTNVTIDIAEINGPFSFYPNPTSVQPGQALFWRNSDQVTHHIVLDDGSVDTGTLAPGTLSQPKTISGSGGTYHCTIHPSMVGRIMVTGAATER